MNENSIYGSTELESCVRTYMNLTQKIKYSNHINWMGIQAMQYPEDMFAIQEIIWHTKPDCIIATGVGKGGTLLYLSSIMQYYNENPLIIGIDPYVTEKTKSVIVTHPAGKGISIINKSSTDKETVAIVKNMISQKQRTNVLVYLDAMHETNFVTTEMNLWSDLVSVDQYLIVGWTVIGESDAEIYFDRAWGKGSNPLIAVNYFLNNNNHFNADLELEKKYLAMTTGKGFLKRVS